MGNEIVEIKTCTFGRMKCQFAIIFFLFSFPALGYDTLRVDLSETWMGYSEDFQKPTGKLNSLHIKLDKSNGSLQIEHLQPFYIFVNNRLQASSVNKIFWPLDSMTNVYSFPLFISVFSKQGLQDLSSQIVSIVPDKNIKNRKYRGDVIIAASIVLLILVVILLNTNSVATKDYFNILKIFSTKHGDEDSAVIRLNSANNIFLILLCASLISLNYFGYFGVVAFKESTSIGNHFIFLSVSLVSIFSILLIKLAITLFSSRLFRLTEFASIQFYNFLRLVLFAFTLASTFLVVAFMAGMDITTLNIILRYVIVGFMGLFVLTTFVKLSTRGGFTVFHLFSYLCFSEIIPGTILLNVFFL